MLASIQQPQIEQRINSGAAALNRELFTRNGLAVITIFGGPGSGKTSLLEATLRTFRGRMSAGAVVGNIRAGEDAQRLRRWSAAVVGIEAHDLDATLLREALQRIDLSALDLLFIERAAAAPPEPQDLGQSAAVGVFSATEGDERVGRYPERVRGADLLLLTKSDLLPFAPFDAGAIRAAANRINPTVPMIQVSTSSGMGLGDWYQWVRDRVTRHCRPRVPEDIRDYYIG